LNGVKGTNPERNKKKKNRLWVLKNLPARRLRRNRDYAR
jgi:hypothetical protein